jgi:hypothetical protein
VRGVTTEGKQRRELSNYRNNDEGVTTVMRESRVTQENTQGKETREQRIAAEASAWRTERRGEWNRLGSQEESAKWGRMSNRQ